MNRYTVVMLAALLAGCTTPAIVSDQLGRNATEMLHADRNLHPGCFVITTTTKTPSSWWSYLAPVRKVTTTLECTQ